MTADKLASEIFVYYRAYITEISCLSDLILSISITHQVLCVLLGS